MRDSRDVTTILFYFGGRLFFRLGNEEAGLAPFLDHDWITWKWIGLAGKGMNQETEICGQARGVRNSFKEWVQVQSNWSHTAPWGSGYRQEVVMEVGCWHSGSPTRGDEVTHQGSRIWWTHHWVLGTEPDAVQRQSSIDRLYTRL